MPFKKKEVPVQEVQTFVHPNPHSDVVCAGCNKPINTVTVREDGLSFHNQYCLNEYHSK